MATTQRILYVSKRRTTSLADVTIDIYNASSTQVVTSGSMTELADGIYYYDYIPTTIGYFTWYADSASESSPMSGQFLSDYSSDTSETVTTATGALATTKELARFMDIEGVVPDYKPAGTARVEETVGTGDASTTKFYLNQSFILDGTQTISYGASVSSLTALTETTHYTINKNNGTLTLTSAGVTAVSTNNIYATYSYCTVELTNTQLKDALNRAQSEMENDTNNRWADGTTTTPDYGQATNEKHDGQGGFNRAYYLDYFPLPNVSTSLSAALGTAAGTATVSSTNGFGTAGTIKIGANKITYTGKTTTTFTGLSGVANAVDSGGTVKPQVIEISATGQGNDPAWTLLDEGTDYDIDNNSGRVHIYRDDLILDVVSRTTYPQRLVPNRFRASYLWGNSTIPNDVKRCVLMIASQDLMHKTARKALVNGLADFRPETLDIDKPWIDKTKNHYRNQRIKNI